MLILLQQLHLPLIRTSDVPRLQLTPQIILQLHRVDKIHIYGRFHTLQQQGVCLILMAPVLLMEQMLHQSIRNFYFLTPVFIQSA